MKIGLIDVDGHNFPNLALMKLAAYHKSAGDTVEWVNYMERYDRVYSSKIFTFSHEVGTVIQAPEVIRGGTGYDIASKLPPEIDAIAVPDYSIYPQHAFSIQFFSRGCIRHCPFCLVFPKEGKIQPVPAMGLNPQGNHIEVLDNNFFANPLWRDAVEALKAIKQPINLHGVDIRIMDEEQALALSSLRLKGASVHIAWDNPKDDILPRLKEMLKIVKRYKVTCYVLIGYWSTREEDYYRVKELAKLGVDPFVQPYRDFENKRTPTQYEKDFASWVNKKERFNAFDFMDFKPRKGFCCKEYFESYYEKRDTKISV
jgi:radical SAM superfamily enzyme YgiQ (UPF0313 family)